MVIFRSILIYIDQHLNACYLYEKSSLNHCGLDICQVTVFVDHRKIKLYNIDFIVFPPIFINNIAENYQYSVELVWFGLWCLMPLSTIFQLYRGSQFMEEISVSGENHRPVASH